MKRTVNCGTHGHQEIGLVCTHIAHATDAGKKVGFFWAEAEGMGRPDAWCSACEALNVKSGATAEWMEAADFKIFCVKCWDFAKEVQVGKPAI